jgi:hypothetical protein
MGNVIAKHRTWKDDTKQYAISSVNKHVYDRTCTGTRAVSIVRESNKQEQGAGQQEAPFRNTGCFLLRFFLLTPAFATCSGNSAINNIQCQTIVKCE